VLPIVLDTSALGATGQVRPVCRSRCDKTHGSDNEEVSIEIAHWSPGFAQVQVVLAVNGMTESTRELTVQAGMNRMSLAWNSGTRPTGDYALQLQILDGSTRIVEHQYQYYQLRTADLVALRQRYDRTGADDHTVEIRFRWLDEMLSTLEPGADPAPLRRLFDESKELVSQVERGQNPLMGVRGYQRRAFRSAIDGTLQPYSVHTYTEGGSPSPMLVFLHGSGVDEVS